MYRAEASPGIAEQRLCRHESYFGRFAHTLRHDYDYSDPLQAVAGGVHAVTQLGGVDPLVRDLGRGLDGNRAPVPELHGALPRLRENTIGLIGDVLHLRLFSAGTKLLNFVGDAAADGADLVAGVHHGQAATHSRIEEALYRPSVN